MVKPLFELSATLYPVPRTHRTEMVPWPTSWLVETGSYAEKLMAVAGPETTQDFATVAETTMLAVVVCWAWTTPGATATTANAAARRSFWRVRMS
jgi:hypothetical protein